MAERECVRCKAKKKNGLRCSRNTCKYSDMCFQHTKQKKGLQVKKSKIKNAGLGLYATKDFQKGQKIADYGGVVVSYSQYEKNPSGYGIHINKKEVLDGKSTQSGLARYANNCRKANKQKGECVRNKAKIKVNTRTKKGTLRATAKIKKGEEIFTSGYGEKWWEILTSFFAVSD